MAIQNSKEKRKKIIYPGIIASLADYTIVFYMLSFVYSSRELKQ